MHVSSRKNHCTFRFIRHKADRLRVLKCGGVQQGKRKKVGGICNLQAQNSAVGFNEKDGVNAL